MHSRHTKNIESTVAVFLFMVFTGSPVYGNNFQDFEENPQARRQLISNELDRVSDLKHLPSATTVQQNRLPQGTRPRTTAVRFGTPASQLAADQVTPTPVLSNKKSVSESSSLTRANKTATAPKTPGRVSTTQKLTSPKKSTLASASNNKTVNSWDTQMADASSSVVKRRRDRQRNIELALQYSSYHYQTENFWPKDWAGIFSVPNKVENTGGLFGVSGSYTQRFWENAPVKSWSDFVQNKFVNMARVEGDISWGSISYKSPTTEKKDGFGVTKINARLLFGYDFPNMDNSLVLTPYLGLGYRRFDDAHSGGWVDWAIDDYKKFGRLTEYYYIPIGLETAKQLNENWQWIFKLEGDIVVGGLVTNRHGDIDGTYTITDVSTGDPVQVQMKDSSARIRRGLGFGASCKFIRKYDLFDLFLEPFFQYWSIAKTAKGLYEASGEDKDWFSVDNFILEPANTTKELGLRMGVRF